MKLYHLAILIIVALIVVIIVEFTRIDSMLGRGIEESGEIDKSETIKVCQDVYYTISKAGGRFRAGTDFEKAIEMAGGRIVMTKEECK